MALSAALEALPRIICRTIRKGRFSEYFSSDDVAQVRSYDLDFILRFGFGIIRGEILESARYGVWSFHHGDESRYRGGPPGFWEIYEDSAICGVILQRLTKRLDAGVVLRRGYFKTLNYSYSRSLRRMLLESADWPALVAGEVRRGRDINALTPSPSHAPIYRSPSNLKMLWFLPKLASNVARRIFERSVREEWGVGIARLSPAEIVAGGRPRGVRWCPRPANGWMADPMALVVNGHIHVLCERMRLDADQGHIAAITFDGKDWTPEHEAIDAGCHAAYPYMFAFGGEVYCVPETSQANEVRLYRAIEFPNKWERAGTLVEGVAAVDNTIFEFGSRWWLFFTAADASDHRLYAFFSSSPFGPWRPHLRNPIKMDVRSSRPAGPPFWFAGSFYRPAQDSSMTYGGRIAVNRIVELSPAHFEEQTVSHLEPERGRYGRALHTISTAGEFCVIDGKRWRLRGIG